MLKKDFLFVLILFILVNFTSSLEFGLSPTLIKISGDVEEKLCKDFSFFGDRPALNGEIKWSKEKSSNLNDYKFFSGESGIESSFPKEISNGKDEICFIGKRPGKYFGVLFYRVENTSYGVGTWIELELIESKKNKFPLISLTGFSIKNLDTSMLIRNQIFFFILLTNIVLIFIFFILLRKKKIRVN